MSPRPEAQMIVEWLGFLLRARARYAGVQDGSSAFSLIRARGQWVWKLCYGDLF